MSRLGDDPAVVVPDDGPDGDDAEAFEDFYRREYPSLVRLATALVARREVAEELVQEAMVTVLGRWSRIRRYDRPGAFARRVVLNAATSFHRRRRAERRALERHGTAETASALSEDSTDFWRAVRALPARQAQAVALYYVEDRSTAQIAELLGIAEGTVRASLHVARTSLARTLALVDEEEMS